MATARLDRVWSESDERGVPLENGIYSLCVGMKRW
jgi:hypothetical protein